MIEPLDHFDKPHNSCRPPPHVARALVVAAIIAGSLAGELHRVGVATRTK